MMFDSGCVSRMLSSSLFMIVLMMWLCEWFGVRCVVSGMRICMVIELNLISSEIVRKSLGVCMNVVVVRFVIDMMVVMIISLWFLSRLLSGMMKNRLSV